MSRKGPSRSLWLATIAVYLFVGVVYASVTNRGTGASLSGSSLGFTVGVLIWPYLMVSGGVDKDATSTPDGLRHFAPNATASGRQALLDALKLERTSDTEGAGKLYQQACSGGVGAGCVNLARLHQRRRLAPSSSLVADELYVRAEPLLDQACTLGDQGACLMLGCQYDRGLGVASDLVRAAQLYDLAVDIEQPVVADGHTPLVRALSRCAKGKGVYCAMVAVSLLEAVGTDRDPETAHLYVWRACELGVLPSCTQFGINAATGVDMPKDERGALRSLVNVCGTSDGKTCASLGTLLMKHKVGGAREVVEQACERGLTDSCAVLRRQ